MKLGVFRQIFVDPNIKLHENPPSRSRTDTDGLTWYSYQAPFAIYAKVPRNKCLSSEHCAPRDGSVGGSTPINQCSVTTPRRTHKIKKKRKYANFHVFVPFDYPSNLTDVNTTRPRPKLTSFKVAQPPGFRDVTAQTGFVVQQASEPADTRVLSRDAKASGAWN
jgi:hypothetical protein